MLTNIQIQDGAEGWKLAVLAVLKEIDRIAAGGNVDTQSIARLVSTLEATRLRLELELRLQQVTSHEAGGPIPSAK